MAWTDPSNPVSATVITVAYAVANLLTQIRWLRTLTGGADPPGTGYMVSSDSTTVTSWKTGIAAIVSVLGFTPINKAGDSGIGSLVSTTGTFSAKGLQAGVDGVSAGVGGVATTGAVNPASYTGGSKLAGSPAVLGFNVGTSGIQSDGAVNPSAYVGGSTVAGVPNVLGLNVGNTGITVGTGGIAISGQINSSVAPGTPPFVVASDTQVANLNAFELQGRQPTTTPTAGAIPIADLGGTLDSWVSASAGAVPSGMGAIWSGTVASIPAGWTRWTALNGRLPVGAGTTFTVAFTEGGSYGSSWSHNHSTPAHSHSGASLSVSGTTGNNNNAGQRGGTGTSTADDPHTHTFSASVGGNTATDGASTSGDTAWVIPMFGVVYVTKV
jgi:hypothetical protein